MDRNNKKITKMFYIWPVANTSTMWQQVTRTTYLPTCSKRAMQKSPPPNKKCFIVFWEKVKKMDY